MYLCIALKDRYHFDVSLFDENIKKETQGKEAVSLLSAVDDFLQENSFIKEDIQGIFVVVGSGTFSTVRSGTVLANAWSLVKKIPVMAITEQQVSDVQALIPELKGKQGFVLPQYNGEPNIRLKKSDA